MTQIQNIVSILTRLTVHCLE